MTQERDHGGDLAQAIAQYGGRPEDWLDLSTGINRVPYPVGNINDLSWRSLPGSAQRTALIQAAQAAFQTNWPLLPLAGAQAAIQLVPQCLPIGQARILGPTYNEFAGALTTFGWNVETVASLEELEGADLAIIVNPNNPTGESFKPEQLIELANSVGTLLIDESFADATPEISVLKAEPQKNILVLRSFGKFFGLAGVRLGFLAGQTETLEKAAAIAGPWAVSGPALEIGTKALADLDWQNATRLRLAQDRKRLETILNSTGWTTVGSTHLFALLETPDAIEAQRQLAQAHIWSRIFPYSGTWLRLGFPGTEVEWQRLEDAIN